MTSVSNSNMVPSSCFFRIFVCLFVWLVVVVVAVLVLLLLLLLLFFGGLWTIIVV